MRLARVVWSAIVLLAVCAGSTSAQVVDTTLWAANGTVSDLVQVGGIIYIGGDFTSVGRAVGIGVRTDPTTGAAQFPVARVAGEGLAKSVRVASPDGSGGWYLGGYLSSVQGQPRTNLAHLDAGGNVTPWNPTADNNVLAIAVSGSTVYIGGNFKQVNGVARNNLAAVDATTGALLSWAPSATFGMYSGTTYSVTGLAVSGGVVYASGSFTAINGIPHSGVVAIDAVTGAPTAWSPQVGLSGPLPDVRAMAIDGSVVYVGGNFTTVNGVTRSRVAAIDAATGALTSWNPSASATVNGLVVSGGRVYGASGNGVFGWNASTAAVEWGASMNGPVLTVSVSGGSVYAGGSFSTAGGQPRNNAAAFSVATSAVTGWNPSVSGQVWTVAASGGTVYVGGYFTLMNVVTRSHLAAIDLATGIATAWDPNITTVIPGPPPYDRANLRALAAGGGYIYAAGDFSQIHGVANGGLAQLDPVTGVPTAWNPSPSYHTYRLAVGGDGTVYAAGEFSTIGGSSRFGVAAIDPVTGSATSWNPNSNGVGYDVVVVGGIVYVGGTFTSIGGSTRNRIAAIDATTGLATAWDPNAGNAVQSIAVAGGTVYACGNFTTMGGLPRSNLAAIDASTGSVTSWAPSTSSTVFDIAVAADRVYFGGIFNTVGGQARKYLGAVNIYNGAPTSWVADLDNYPTCLAVAGDRLFVGGGFSVIAGLPQSCFAGVGLDHTPLLGVADPARLVSAITLVEPNPSDGDLHVRYAVAREGPVKIELVDVAGRAVATLANRVHRPGRYDLTWDGGRGSRAPGVYFIRLTSADRISARKIALLH